MLGTHDNLANKWCYHSFKLSHFGLLVVLYHFGLNLHFPVD